MAHCSFASPICESCLTPKTMNATGLTSNRGFYKGLTGPSKPTCLAIPACVARHAPIQSSNKPFQHRLAPIRRLYVSRKHLQTVAARTESADLPLGNSVPDFELIEPLSGQNVQLQHAAGSKGTLIVFMCNHCPFVIHLRDALVQLASNIKEQGIETIAISSNSVITHPQDGPEKMAEDAKSFGYPFKYLYDESQDIAKAYKAACTPEFYLADASLKLFYHGQFDGSRPKTDAPVTGEDIKQAIDSMLSNNPLKEPQRPSMGCGIKWHPSKQPA